MEIQQKLVGSNILVCSSTLSSPSPQPLFFLYPLTSLTISSLHYCKILLCGVGPTMTVLPLPPPPASSPCLLSPASSPCLLPPASSPLPLLVQKPNAPHRTFVDEVNVFELDKVNHWLKGKHKRILLLFSDLVVVAKKNKDQYVFKQSIALHDVMAVPFQSARKSTSRGIRERRERGALCILSALLYMYL